MKNQRCEAPHRTPHFGFLLFTPSIFRMGMPEKFFPQARQRLLSTVTSRSNRVKDSSILKVRRPLMVVVNDWVLLKD